ncbi:MAG: flagellar export protein FliJ [Proteobacteria bacterium]|nr:flagellar export protein FliJ [Pseudomonadota bacterium]HQR05012.1 flagellar export protein FliJ [Rhodocyclaceae bacterium]
MSQVFPLQILLDLSQNHLDEATRRLGELVTGEQQAKQRLEMLVQYRSEYRTRFQEAARDGLDYGQLRNYQSFLLRLDDAIAQASRLMEQASLHTSTGRQEWLDRSSRVRAFDTLADHHKTKCQQAERRQEQKIQDGHAARNTDKFDK